jgi:hypothetical protein
MFIAGKSISPTIVVLLPSNASIILQRIPALIRLHVDGFEKNQIIGIHHHFGT